LSFGQLRSLLLLPLVFASLLLMTGCGPVKTVLTDLALGAVGVGSDKGINADLTAQIGKENTKNTALNTTLRPTIRGEGNTGSIKQDTSDTKVENNSGGSVTINQIDPLVFLTLIGAFVLWSYFLYRLPSPSQIWKKNK